MRDKVLSNLETKFVNKVCHPRTPESLSSDFIMVYPANEKTIARRLMERLQPFSSFTIHLIYLSAADLALPEHRAFVMSLLGH